MEKNKFTIFQKNPLLSWIDNVEFDIEKLSKTIDSINLYRENVHIYEDDEKVVPLKIGKGNEFSLRDKFIGECNAYLRKTLPDVFSDDVHFFRAHVNKNPKGIQNFFHLDSPEDYESITSLWYLDEYDDFNDGGETKFIINTDGSEELFSLLPKYGRVAIFDGNILHSPTSFWSKDRTILAIKYIISNENSPIQVKKNTSII